MPQTRTTLTRWLIVLTIALISSILGFLLWEHPWLATVERASLDLRMRMQEADPNFGDQVLIVAIDDTALAPFPYFVPTPRPLLAALIDMAVRQKAALVAVDLPLDEDTSEVDDQLMEGALIATPRVVLASFEGDRPGEPWRLPLPRFIKDATSLGVVPLPDVTGERHIRKAPLWRLQGDAKRATFPVAVFLAMQGIGGDPAYPSLTALRLKAPEMVDDGNDSYHLDYHPPTQPREGIDIVTASDLLAGLVEPARIKDHVVLIGGGKEMEHEQFFAPFDYDGGDPGIGKIWVTATAVATLLEGAALTPAPKEMTFGFILLLSVALAMIQARYGVGIGVGAVILLTMTYSGIAFVMFIEYRQTLPFAQFVLAILITYLGSALYLSITEGREKRWIKSAFSRYLSPAYIDRLLADPGSLELGGEERELTILFTDIEGFTTISASLAPAMVVSLLNRYFSRLTEVVTNHGGTLDKYQGDAVMAFWGAPLASTRHAEDAVASALTMAETSRLLSEEFAAEGFPPLKTRIGINTGRVIVGNIGSTRRFNYTIIGDAVNVASRLEGACRFYGARTLLAEHTVEKLDASFTVRPIDRLAVKGKDEPLSVYEVIGGPNLPVTPTMERLLPIYADGERAYRERRWNEAIDRFVECLAIVPDDGPSATLLERAKEFASTPPTEGWDGVYRPGAK